MCKFKHINWFINQKKRNFFDKSNKTHTKTDWRWHCLDLDDFNYLQFLIYNEFALESFNHLQNLTKVYARKYGRILSTTGTIFDYDSDGLADTTDLFWRRNEKVGLELLPSHFFRMLMRCEDGQWHLNGMSCRHADKTRILTFVLPNDPRNLNCMVILWLLFGNNIADISGSERIFAGEHGTRPRRRIAYRRRIFRRTDVVSGKGGVVLADEHHDRFVARRRQQQQWRGLKKKKKQPKQKQLREKSTTLFCT